MGAAQGRNQKHPTCAITTCREYYARYEVPAYNHGLDRAGSGRSENCDGPGRAETFKNVMGQAGPARDFRKFDGPGRAGP